MESSTASKRGVDAATIAEAFRLTSAQRAGEIAVRTKNDEVAWTWGELRERVDVLAGGLAGLGLRKGDTIALMLGNRPEFHLADLAAMMVGATPFSIYMTYAPNQIEYVVADAGARILITEQQFLANVLEARKTLPDLEHVIVIDGDAPAGTMALADVPAADFDVEASVAALGPEDVLTLIYTSGTTGPPKGVELAHRNLLAAVAGIEDIVEFPDGARVISWLPNAHIAERAAHHYLPIVFGFQVTCCPNPREIVSFLPEFRPNWFFAVPR
ncbi:MAG: long-chain acyl-CoA synthetase, partial [Baekduia sp.]|nr:long-chain acyl-CoA synthetase [Baekduia sp.]